tara:strand:- start:1200 stop:3080 length:1881 start_codon:yes stop_codon:yes gene_type:complete
MLREERRVREEKIAAIDEQTRQAGETLANAPQGEHAGYNDWVMGYSVDAQKALLMQDRLLKSGQLSLRDYTLQRQNILDGTEEVFGIMKSWNEDYEERMNQMQDGTAAEQQNWQMMELESFGNFNSHGLYINPTNFSVSLGKKQVKDPSKPYHPTDNPYVAGLSQNPNDFSTVQGLKNRLNQTIERVDLGKNLAGEVENFADVYKEVIWDKRKNIKTEDSIERMNEWDNIKRDVVNAQLVNPTAVGSILTDTAGVNPDSITEENPSGTSWGFTRDPEAAANDANLILLVPDPNQPNSGMLVPDFSTENGQRQMEIAYEVVANKFESQLEKTQEPMSQFAPQQQRPPTNAQLNKKKDDRATLGHMTNVSNLMSGNKAAFESTSTDVVKTFENVEKGVWRPVNFTRENGVITVTLGDGRGNEKQEVFDQNAEGVTEENIGQELWQFVVPNDANISYQEGLTVWNESEGGGFVPRMIEDTNNPGQMIPNPAWKGEESGSYQAPFVAVNNKNADINQVYVMQDGETITLAQQLNAVDYSNEGQIQDAVKNSLSNMLKDINPSIKTKFIDNTWPSKNELEVTVDGKLYKIKGGRTSFDKTKIQNLIEKIARENIDKWNNSEGGRNNTNAAP